MKTRKNFVGIAISTLLLSCLVSMIVTTRSVGTDSINWNIWADINFDGMVDIYDAIHLANAYGSSGDSINKTALLLECNATYASLMSRMDYLNASFIDLLAAVEGMNATNLMPLINELNSSLLGLQSDVTALGTTVTQLQASDASQLTALAQLGQKVDNINATLSGRIATLEAQVATMNTMIVTMNAAITQLQNSNAILSASVAECRSLIDALNITLSTRMNVLDFQLWYLNATVAWLNGTVASKLGAPEYDSGWYTINQGQSIVLNHNLGTTNVIVYMIGNDTDSTRYVQQIGFGGDSYFGGAGGAYWYELTSTTIKTTRAANDNDWHQMRVFIWKIYK